MKTTENKTRKVENTGGVGGIGMGASGSSALAGSPRGGPRCGSPLLFLIKKNQHNVFLFPKKRLQRENLKLQRT